MPIKIPDDAKVITDRRLDTIRVLGTLHDSLIAGKGGLKDQVKAAMASKGASFAQSELACARLQAGSRSTIDPRDLYQLVKTKQITLDQFLGCISVRKEPLAELLGGAQIDAISTTITTEPALYTEFRPGVLLGAELLDTLATGALQAVAFARSSQGEVSAAR